MGVLKKKPTERVSGVMPSVEPKASGAKVLPKIAVEAKPQPKPKPKAVPRKTTDTKPVVAASGKQTAKGTVGAVTQVAAKSGKTKLVRDSFTMPRDDFELIAKLKERALGFKQPVKKSELLRAGLHALNGLTDAKLKAVLGGLTPLKAGRPKKQDA